MSAAVPKRTIDEFNNPLRRSRLTSGKWTVKHWRKDKKVCPNNYLNKVITRLLWNQFSFNVKLQSLISLFTVLAFQRRKQFVFVKVFRKKQKANPMIWHNYTFVIGQGKTYEYSWLFDWALLKNRCVVENCLKSNYFERFKIVVQGRIINAN